MKKRKVFSTVFFDIENIHLIKDPGMIPFTMQKDYGFHSIVPISSAQEYPYIQEHYGIIETPAIKDSSKSTKSTIKYIKRLYWIYKNAKKIDVLNLYFFDLNTWIGIMLYKIRNKKGLVYVHCDTDGQYLLNFDLKKKSLKNFTVKHIFLKDKYLTDVLWGIQNNDNKEKLMGKWPFINTEFIPNGVYWPTLSDASNKDRTLLTVARNGTPQKKQTCF